MLAKSRERKQGKNEAEILKKSRSFLIKNKKIMIKQQSLCVEHIIKNRKKYYKNRQN